MSRKILFAVTLSVLVLFSCAKAPVQPDVDVRERPDITVKEPEPGAEPVSLFNYILDVSSSGDRRDALPRMEKAYLRIVREYPQEPLAQESCWRLIKLYLDDYSPPLYDKAEILYAEFVRNYPQSFLKGLIMETLSKSYYKKQEWGRMLNLTQSVFMEYTLEGKRPRPLLLFMYAEANYHLGNLPEAEEGFKVMVNLFPKSSKTARERLGEIQKR